VPGVDRYTDFGEHFRDRPPPSGEDAGSHGVGDAESLDDVEHKVVRQTADPIFSLLFENSSSVFLSSLHVFSTGYGLQDALLTVYVSETKKL
jgi:hypothetical protein